MIHPVRIPHEQVNDQSVLLVEWMVADGTEVRAGQPIAVIETSKSTAEIEAPEAGFLRHGSAANVELPVGAVFCHVTTSVDEPVPTILPTADAPASLPALATLVIPATQPPAVLPNHATSTSPAVSAGETTFSRKALELIERHGLTKDRFAGRGLVRESDVQAELQRGTSGPSTTAAPEAAKRPAVTAGTASAPSAPVGASGVPLRIEDLSRAKRVEIKYLASGAAHTLASVVTVPCPTAGLRTAWEQTPALGNRGAAVIIYETARLLKKYPIFNAYYADGKVHYYEHVNIGCAVDGGLGLKVPVIAQADLKGLPDIARELEELLLDYVNDALPLSALAGGTFTITDLSTEGVTAFHPLINQGQCAILGIGAEFTTSDPGRPISNLMLAFDHQLSEGRTAAQLLCELRDRIASYEGVAAGGAPTEWGCVHCGRSRTELAGARIPLLQEVTSTGGRSLICRTCLGSL